MTLFTNTGLLTVICKGEECASKFNRSFLAKVLYANGALELEKYPVAIEELRKAEILAGDNEEYIMQVLYNES